MSEVSKARPVIRGSVTLPGAARRIYFATPAYGATFCGDYVRSMFALLTTKTKVATDYSFHYFDYADVVTARNYLISDFYFNHAKSSHLLFVDDDMGFEPKLIHAMLDLNEDLVGTIYPKRKVDLKKLHAAGDLPFEKALARASEFIGEERKPQQRKNGFVNVTHCGTGIMLISRACVERMVATLPELVDTVRVKRMPFADRFEKFITPFDKIKTDDFELSEDFSFCRRWVGDCGGTIWAHPGEGITHVGAMTYGANYNDR
ncbi:MAG TPA: hypothetical protein VG889_12430 [Rhizomicrobium sp.]|nr:hypothetical protein [Rhizomicrobium sp.]